MGLRSVNNPVSSFNDPYSVTGNNSSTPCDPNDYNSGCFVSTPVDWGGDRGLWAGGVSPSYRNTIDYMSLVNGGSATDFGDLQSSRYDAFGLSNGSRGVFAAGHKWPGYSEVIDYITIQTPGNATDFGDMTYGARYPGATGDNTRGVYMGGDTGSMTNQIDYITIQTTANAADFGDLSQGVANCTSCSDSHGGLGDY